MKRTLIIFSFLLLSLFIASGQTRPRFEIESKYSLVHSNFGLMWLARAGGAVHVSNDWALNVEFGEGASAINTYNHLYQVAGSVGYYFFQGGPSKFDLVSKIGGGLLWDRQADGSNMKKGFFFIEGNPRYNLTDNFFVGVSMYGLFAKDLRLTGFCNGLSVGVRF